MIRTFGIKSKVWESQSGLCMLSRCLAQMFKRPRQVGMSVCTICTSVVLGYVCMQSNARSIDCKIKISACSQKHWRCSTSCSIRARLNSLHTNINIFIREYANLLSYLINGAYMCYRILLKQISRLCTISEGLICIPILYTHMLKVTQKNSQVKTGHEWQRVRSSCLTQELELWFLTHSRAQTGERMESNKPDWHARLFSPQIPSPWSSIFGSCINSALGKDLPFSPLAPLLPGGPIFPFSPTVPGHPGLQYITVWRQRGSRQNHVTLDNTPWRAPVWITQFLLFPVSVPGFISWFPIPICLLAFPSLYLPPYTYRPHNFHNTFFLP